MASTARTSLRARLGVLIAASLVVTALTAATAAASAPSPMGAALEPTRLGATASPGIGPRTSASTRPRTAVPGFQLDRGRYLKFDAPRAGTETAPGAINNRGQIVGSTVDADTDATYHGFLRDTRGRFTTIDVPGARATAVSKINDLGQIVGRYYQTTPFRPPGSKPRGFLLDHGKLTRLDVPAAAETQAVGINNRGQVVGEYRNADGTYHGFLWQRGRFTTIDLPGAAGSSLVDINDRGQILGSYLDTAGRYRGFVLADGRYTTFDAPGVPLILPRDINNRGQIVGLTLTGLEERAQGARGFLLAKGVKGPFTPIDVPGAPRSAVSGINDRGQLVGFYENLDAPDPQPTGTQQPMGRMA
jgi:probable HAF family extracellular repeat protein